MSAHGGPNIVEDGLVLALDAANVKSYPGSGTTWFDLSGRGNHCSLFNSPTFSTKSNGCLNFSTNQYGTISSLFDMNFDSNFTISMWFSPFSTLTGSIDVRQSLWSYNVASGLGIEIGNFTNGCAANGQGTDGRRFLIHRQGACFSNISNTFQFSQNEQLNFTYTRNSSRNGKFYKNGFNISSVNDDTSFVFSTPTSIDIARRAAPITQYFNGDIYYISYYNRTLSAQEILQNYNATKGRYGL
jgi:hypothetical protein